MDRLELYRESVRRALGGKPPITAAKGLGLPRLAIQQVLKGHEPRLRRATEIAEALGLEFYIGPPRSKAERVVEMPTGFSSSSRRLDTACREAREAIDRAQLALDELHNVEVLATQQDDGVSVAVRELRTAAGGGAFDLDESISGHVYFKTSWLRKHRLKPDQCCVITVTGESMEPTLSNSCAILLDQSRRRRRADSIYVVRGPDGLIVKRAKKSVDGEWLLASDNEDWPPVPWPVDAEIVGQVIWAARELL